MQQQYGFIENSPNGTVMFYGTVASGQSNPGVAVENVYYWQRPNRARFAMAFTVGGGAGACGGYSTAASSNYGGGGSSGAASNVFLMDLRFFGKTQPIYVGTGSAGGVGSSFNSGAPTAGFAGGDTVLFLYNGKMAPSQASYWIISRSRGSINRIGASGSQLLLGIAGANTLAYGISILSNATSKNGTTSNGTSNATDLTDFDNAGTLNIIGSATGAGGTTALGAAYTNAGNITFNSLFNINDLIAPTTDGANGIMGYSTFGYTGSVYPWFSTGGTGGTGSILGAGGRGGNGGGPGAAGGGGGGSSAAAGGNGGDGGPGLVMFTYW